jgi:hypothetical protein
MEERMQEDLDPWQFEDVLSRDYVVKTPMHSDITQGDFPSNICKVFWGERIENEARLMVELSNGIYAYLQAFDDKGTTLYLFETYVDMVECLEFDEYNRYIEDTIAFQESCAGQ